MNTPLAHTPPMGWNSWNTFGWNISEELIKTTADFFVESGLKDAGYEYIVIDDCWSEKQRDENGRLVPDKYKFPNGIKPVADYIHSKGLKFGLCPLRCKVSGATDIPQGVISAPDIRCRLFP